MVRGGVMASARKVMAAPTTALRSVLTAAMASNDNASFSPPLDRVPGDVLIEIATYLPCPAEILHLCLVVSSLFDSISSPCSCLIYNVADRLTLNASRPFNPRPRS